MMKFGISEAINHWGKYIPKKVAMKSDERLITYSELNHGVEWLAQDVFEEIGSDKKVAILFEDRDTLLISLIATLRSNNKVAIMNPGSTVDTLERNIEDAEVSLVMTDRENESKFENYKKSVSVDTKIIDYSRIIKKSEEIDMKLWRSSEPDEVWGIIYTSGTTGRPKGIIRSHFSILSELIGWIIELEMTRESHFYIGRPVYYTGGLVLALSTLFIGGTTTLFRNHTPERYMNYVKQSKVDISFFIPSQINELVKFASKSKDKKIGEGKILVMGAPISADLKKRAHKLLDVDIIESWGNSEGLGTITDPSDLELRPKSIGRPFLTDDLFIVNESRQRVPPGTIGRIAGLSDSNFTGYNKREDLNAKLVFKDMIISDDLGYQDEEGFFYICSKVSELILRNGVNIFPGDIEEVIYRFNEIEEVSVFGIPSEEEGEVPVAVVRVSRNFDNEENLLRLINEKLDDNQKLYSLKIIDKFPKTASGKIRKEKLKELFYICQR